MFDKYQKYGAYHWKDIDSSSFFKVLNRSLPLYTRYQKCLRHIPEDACYGVEIGCGDGALTYLMAGHGIREVLGCDTDSTGINLAMKQVKDLPLANSVRFECRLFQDCNIETESVDVVVLADVIEHIKDPISLLQEIKRVGKPGGQLIVTTPRARKGKLWDTHHVHEYVEESLRQLLKEFFPETYVTPFMPLLFYTIYNSSFLFRFLFNTLTNMGMNPFSIRLHGHQHVMLLGVSCFG